MIKYKRVVVAAFASGLILLSAVSTRAAYSAGGRYTHVQSISPSKRLITVSMSQQSVLSLAGSRTNNPYVAFPFIANGQVSYSVERQGMEAITFSGSIPELSDTAQGGQGIAQPDLRALAAGNGILLKKVGVMRGESVYSLLVQPYQYNAATRQMTFYETVNVTLTSTQPFPSSFNNPSEALTREVVNKVQSTSPPPTGSYIRIVVNKDGIYHITGNELDTSGVNLSGFTSQNITLWNHGKQIPIYVHTTGGTAFTSNSYFEFYGTANRVDYSGGRPDLYLDPFTDNNVYFLTKDSTAPVQRLVTESGALGRVSNAVDLSAYSFTQTVHAEQDLRYERLDNVDLDRPYDTQDHWFWGEVSSQQMINLPFYLAYPDTTNIQPLTLTAAFQGITHLDGTNGSPNVPNEHQAELFINQTHVMSTTWDGQNSRIVDIGADANIPQSVLHNGANEFRVYDANPGNIAVATLAFNWAELHYQRLYVADKDYLKFAVPDNAQPGYYNFLIQNFQNSSISVYRLNDSRITDVTIKYLNNQGTAQGYAVLFQAYVQSPNDQFIAVSDSGKLSPVKIEQVADAGLSSYDYAADYIIIASRQLDDVTGKQQDQSNPVNQLAAYYNSHGTRTIVVDAAQVYDDFTYGIKSPYAIRSFLSYAYHNWSVAPKYVLLVGEGTWDTKNGNDVNDLIPVMMMQTYRFGATASDNFYACVDGNDPIPDLAVGRIPATNITQVKATVDKILAYYSGKNYGWQNTALLIAGEEEEFHVQADSVVRSMIPPNYFIKRLYTSIQDPAVDTKYYGVTQDLVNDINQGAVLVNYMGHGGGAIWADNGILTNDEVSNLSNSGKYPFVTSMTCFAGAFDGQIGLPLCSTLLFAQNKGAVSLLGSAGLGWLYNDFFMDSELLPVLFDSSYENTSIGTDIILAKALYYASYFYWPQAPTMLNQYNIIGDPALIVQFPPNTSRVRLDSYTAVAGQNISGNISNAPAGGTGVIQVTNGDGDVIAQTDVTIPGSGSATFSIPYSSGLSGLSHVKAYTYNSSTQSSTFIDLSTAGAFAQVSSFGITSNGSVFRIRIGGLASSSSPVSAVTFVGKVYAAGASGGSQPLMPLNVPLLTSGPNEYLSDFAISADSLKPGETISGFLEATFSDGSTTSSQPVSHTVPGAADISAFSRQSYMNVNSSMKVAIDSVIRLEATVYDWNSVAAKDVRVDFYDGVRGNGTFLGSSRVSFDTSSVETAAIPVALSPGNHTVYMYIVFDSLTDGYDLVPANDYAYGNVYVNLVTASPQGVVGLDSAATLSGAAPGEIFKVDTTSPPLYSQPLLNPARDRTGRIHFYEFASANNSQSGSYALSLAVNNPDSITNTNLAGLHLYLYDPRTRTLNIAGGSYSAGKVTGNVGRLGVFTAAFSSDRTPPQLTISAGDQFFSNGDYVPPNPRFSILMHDEDGVDLGSGSIDIRIDNQKVDPTLVTVPDSVSNPTSVTATVQLPVTDGSHTLRITAEDANGNISAPVMVDFVVRSDFSLRVYGAYPDPFVNQTFIAFEVTSGNPIDAVEIKIYSVSGRLIKTIRYPSTNPMETLGLLQGGTGSPTAVGYHEAWWDGTDNFGNQVANGVYFYKVSVSSGGKTLVDIGKMARLR